MSHQHDDGGMPMAPPGNTNQMSQMTMMQMSFYWGKDAIVLFSGWPNQSLGMYVLALFFVFLLALAIEVLSISSAVKPDTNPIAGALTQAGIYAFRMGFAYLVMLSVMSFNLGIFIAAVVGHVVGFFFVKYRALVMAKRVETMSSTGGIIPKV